MKVFQSILRLKDTWLRRIYCLRRRHVLTARRDKASRAVGGVSRIDRIRALSADELSREDMSFKVVYDLVVAHRDRLSDILEAVEQSANVTIERRPR